MKRKRGILLILSVFLLFGLIISFVEAEENFNTKVSSTSFEIYFDNSTLQLTHPLEHGIDRIIKIKNIKNEPIIIELRSYVSINDKEEEVRSFPQPFPKYFGPNEEKEIFLKLEFSRDMYSKWIKGNTYKTPFNIEVFTYPNNQKESKQITLQNEIFVLEKEEGANNLPKNSQIKGLIVDSITNESIRGARVKVWSDWPIVNYEANADDFGVFTTGVHAYQSNMKHDWIQYSIFIEKDGYERYNYAFSPKINEQINFTARMVKNTEKAEYQLIKKYDTGLPPYKIAYSKNGDYFVTVPFHSSESMEVIKEKAYLHLFSSNGSLVCRFKLENEIPTVDISSDASLIATVQRILIDRWDGGNNVLLLDNNCNEIWRYEIRTEDSGPSEVKISHDKKYLAVGTYDGQFFLFDIPEKKLLWNYSTGNGQSRYILFNEDDSGIFYSADPNLFHFNLNGSLDWKVFVGAWTYSLDLSKNYVAAGVKAGRFISLINKTSGEIIWRYPVDNRPDALLISPDEGYLVYQCSNGGLPARNLFLNLSGDVLFNLQTGSAAQITKDSNYLAYYGGGFARLVNRRGNELWSYQLDNEKWPGPNGFTYISDDKKRIVVGNSMDGNVYFFEGGIEKTGETDKSPPQNQEEMNPIIKKSIWQKIKEWFSSRK